jgi:hypothetical protein
MQVSNPAVLTLFMNNAPVMWRRSDVETIIKQAENAARRSGTTQYVGAISFPDGSQIYGDGTLSYTTDRELLTGLGTLFATCERKTARHFMKNKLTAFAAVFIVALLACTACNKATLQSGGPYTTSTTVLVGTNLITTTTQDLGLYNADSAFVLAYKTVDMIFTVEFNNRAYFWSISPSIKHAVDAVRVQAVKVRDDYISARAAYLANPTPLGLVGVQTAVAKIQQLVFAAQAALAQNASALTNTIPVLSTNK